MHITSRVARSLEKNRIVKFKVVWQNIVRFNQTGSTSQITQAFCSIPSTYRPHSLAPQCTKQAEMHTSEQLKELVVEFQEWVER